MREEDFARDFRSVPLEKAMEMPFKLAHFKLDYFFGRGQLLHGYPEGMMSPMQKFLGRAGYSWHRSYPIIFISGARTPGNYHADNSHVVACQLYGTKIFHSLKDPERWDPATDTAQAAYKKQIKKPEGITEDDRLACEMKPGDALWVQILTPHWVDTGDDGQIAASTNISFGGLCLNGKLSRNGAILAEHWKTHPDEWF